jgi:hypothetical protein
MRNYIDLITEGRQNQILIENFEHAGKMISEAKLTPDQIGQIFKGIEQNMTAAGGNRTAVGKGVDTAKSAAGAVGKAYNGLINKFSDTKVMQGFDAAYDKAAEQLKQATGGDQGAMQYVQKYRDFAKKHPMAQTAIYALLIAAVSIGSGGAAAPAALGLLKMGDRLVQGDKFSQALAKGATTAGAAAVGQGIKGALSGQDVPSTGDKSSMYNRDSKIVNRPGDFDGPVNDPGTSSTAKAIQAAQSSNLSKQDMMNDFAKKMGLTGDNHKAVFKGGVPVEIDGKPVPQNLYTPDQAQNVDAAKKMAAQMANPTAAATDVAPKTATPAANTGYELKKGPDGLEGPIVSKNGQIVPNTGASSAADAAPSNKPSVAANQTPAPAANTAPVKTGPSSSVSDFDPEDDYDDEPLMRGGNQGYPIRSGGVGYNQGYDTRGYPIRSGGAGYNQDYGNNRGSANTQPTHTGGAKGAAANHNGPNQTPKAAVDTTPNKTNVATNQTPGGAKAAVDTTPNKPSVTTNQTPTTPKAAVDTTPKAAVDTTPNKPNVATNQTPGGAKAAVDTTPNKTNVATNQTPTTPKAAVDTTPNNKPSVATNQTPTGKTTGYELKKGPNGLEGPIVSKDGKIVKETIETMAINAATYNFDWIALPTMMMIDYKKSYQPNYLGESAAITNTVLTREGVQCVFSNLERLHEHLLEAESEYGAEVKKPGIFGRLGAGIKKAAGAVASSKLGQAVGQGVQAVKTTANNATTTVTADKLQKAWQANRSPMDTKGLMNFLTQQGVDKSVIAATYKSLGIPLQTGGRVAGQGPSQTANAIRKRDARAANKAAPGTVPSAAPEVAIQQEKPAGQPQAQFGQQWTAQATAAPNPQTPQPTNTSGTATANFGAVWAQQEQPKKIKKTVSKRLEV